MAKLGKLLRRWRPGGRPDAERLHILRYHGLWGPGVRLLQNLRFRDKAWLLVICLMLPLGYLLADAARDTWLQVREARQAEAAMRVYRAVTLEIDALSAVTQTVFDLESDPAQATALTAALARENQLAAALGDAVAAEPLLAEALKGHLRLAQDARREVSRLSADQRPASADAIAPRYNDLNEIVALFDALRRETLRLGGSGLHDDQTMLALLSGGLERLPPLMVELRRSARTGARVFPDQERHSHAVRLMERAVGMQLHAEAVQLALAPMLARGVIDATTSRRELDRVLAFSAQVRRLALAGMVANSSAALVTAAGLDPSTYARLVREAVDDSLALQGQVLQAADAALALRVAKVKREAAVAVSVAALGVLLMAYVMFCLNKVVGGGLAELCARVEALAQGDMSPKPEARGSDEVGRALTALSTSTLRMSTLFEAVTQGVAAVSFASREVAVGNAGLNGRTGDIRRSIGDVGERARASMEAMDRAGVEVDRIADHMREVRADAQRSRKAMNELVQRMQALQSKSREIGRVVLLVESVAHQTRLLSLNASVEAARAGPAGKGFSVVAQEVRDLARRSEAAAHKIAEIVQASVGDIEEGSMLTDRVGESVRMTDERVAEVSAIMGDIVRLTRAGLDQSQEVVGITRQVEDSASGNARMVEQLAHASAGLREQGDHLKRSMQHFVFG